MKKRKEELQLPTKATRSSAIPRSYFYYFFSPALNLISCVAPLQMSARTTQELLFESCDYSRHKHVNRDQPWLPAHSSPMQIGLQGRGSSQCKGTVHPVAPFTPTP